MSENKNLYAVILAGGSGTRFWPMSRANYPKQFLKIAGKQTLLEQTVSRIASLVPAANTLIVTNAAFERQVRQQLNRFGIRPSNILLEPSGKNTAPAIAWAASHILAKNPKAVMAIFPSDHLILKPQAFRRYLTQAVSLAGRHYLVTMGIVPTRPETGYGYLKTKLIRVTGRPVFQVAKFTEKPSLSVARKFIRSRQYLWNSGMFIWRVEDILQAFHRHLPAVAGFFEKYKTSSAVRKFWKKLPSISIDYGILEKAGNVVTVSAKDMGWSDLGIWESLMEVLPVNKEGNIIDGDVVQIGCRDTLIFGHQRLVTTIGLENMVVVDTPDALLICRKDLSRQVKDLVAILKSQNRKEL